MKKILLFVTLFNILSYNVKAQVYHGNAKSGAKKPKIGEISGKIIDKQTKEPVEFATIVLVSIKTNNSITGGVTNQKGYFKINEIPVGLYKVKISFIGYLDFIIDSVRLSRDKPEKYFGTIKLKSNVQSLGEVSIEGEKKIFQNTLDKKIINVDKDITSEGASVSEVLQNVPSVDVDVDGNISLRGSQNVKVLIDGKPSGILGSDIATVLDQLPASSIETIEIITNPSAKYDPEGMAGIINIKLKKNNLKGTNGSVKLTAGTNNKYNGSINLNHRNGKFNIFTNYSYRYNERDFTRISNMKYFPSDSVFYIDQHKNGERISQSHMVNSGFDYYINNKNTITLTGMFNQSNRERNSDSWNNTFDSERILSNLNKSISTNPTNSIDMDYSLSYKKEFEKPGTELNTVVMFSTDDDNKTATYTTQDYNVNGVVANNTPDLQNAKTLNNYKNINAKLNYENKLSENGKFEAGYDYRAKIIDNDYTSSDYDYSLLKFIDDTLLKNHFNYTEQIHAAYGIYSNKYKKISYQGGLRLEQVFREFVLLTNNENYKNSQFNYYPSIHTSYEITKNQSAQISYSRRVNRPSTRELNPFKDYSDPLNVHKGNPELLPEYINSYELGYEYKWKTNSILANVYYKKINNMIRRYKTVDSLGVSTITFQNLESGENSGVELSSVINLYKWQSFNWSFNLFQTKIDATNLESDLNSENFGWSAKAMSNTVLPYKFIIQISFRYHSPILIPQGEIKAMYNTDLAIRKNILKNKGTLSLRVSDIFNTRKFSIYLLDASFEQNFTHTFESRVLYLTFNYRFGKQFKSEKYNKNKGDYKEGGEMNIDL